MIYEQCAVYPWYASLSSCRSVTGAVYHGCTVGLPDILCPPIPLRTEQGVIDTTPHRQDPMPLKIRRCSPESERTLSTWAWDILCRCIPGVWSFRVTEPFFRLHRPLWGVAHGHLVLASGSINRLGVTLKSALNMPDRQRQAG
jgi:hypothetical protein